jgi:hypothetical protein
MTFDHTEEKRSRAREVALRTMGTSRRFCVGEIGEARQAERNGSNVAPIRDVHGEEWSG